ncbi:TIGR02679 family protein [Effusibacillus consociatus]|uniref:TIGR02679 family protein n=1 Tax=Effusibacillus consociatus TaxID=1117041 RepID=A0ABV9Q6T5_9BACL
MSPSGTNTECLDFLRQPGLQRMWPLVRKKYESYGRVAGTIHLSGLREEEREALEGLFATNMLGRTDFRFRLAELEKVLQETRFRLSVEDCLRLLYGEEWITKREQRETEKRAWERFCRWAARFARKEELKIWIEQLRAGSGGGYRVFLECYRDYCERGNSPAWATALSALEQLPACNERLPVFAARTTGDPHGLDRSTLAGRIFYWGMTALQYRYRQGSEPGIQEPGIQEPGRTAPQEDGFEETPSTDEADPISDNSLESVSQSEVIRAQYAFSGIVLDDISSIVWVAGWGEYAKDPVALPLLTVDRLDTARLPSVSEVFVVENPSIFGVLVDWGSLTGSPLPFPLLCTSGQPSLAALRLLDKITDEQSRIHYSGDFDVKGLTMATGLLQRYGNRFAPWRLDAETYRDAIRGDLPSFSEAEIQALERMEVPWDDRLLKVMRESGRKVFQEQILDLLLADWKAMRLG